MRLRGRIVVAAICATALLPSCAGWEGPGNWLHEDHAVGKAASVCTPAQGDTRADYAATYTFDTDFAGWNGSVRAQSVTCRRHRDPLKVTNAAWIECVVEGPALITHSPPIGGEEAFVASDAFDLRVTRRGISCRPASP